MREHVHGHGAGDERRRLAWILAVTATSRWLWRMLAVAASGGLYVAALRTRAARMTFTASTTSGSAKPRFWLALYTYGDNRKNIETFAGSAVPFTSVTGERT